MAKIVQILLICLALPYKVQNTQSHSVPSYGHDFCKGNEEIHSIYSHYSSMGYTVIVNKTMTAFTDIKVKLDSGSTILLEDESRFSAETDTINNIFSIIITKDVEKFSFTVKGRYAPNHPPYIISLKINGVENCKEPDRTYFQHNDLGYAKLFDKAPDKFCGRRRINRRYTELIVSGSATQAGDWPWHAAIMRLNKSTLKYICGGTLISKYVVLTAAHCAAINGVPVNPEIMQVVLGKHSLLAKDVALQEKDIFKVIVHDEFKYKTLANDIALLKFTTEAIFNNYVQPACLWFNGIYDHLGSYEVNGTEQQRVMVIVAVDLWYLYKMT
ncbi:uncharacterized protein LOC120637059 isoform X2 [Pararge aegeria]|uniref:uncharacterized protein LOC120637059 isoform X2 n=1 Tax=Pararge aegeria TaxID=116150 RepID=UPI0019D0F895|nr:uncharacterized protein LOC120637059 isoform X2 [Pararge aegeria]